ncbi:MAG TPA: MazG nucleotide pyrophosphohydrolase domain-containing protein [Candidatus Deferrimicrobium sp.]|nr:MazG nucleotide pyrophosphohydrolase domain-containing protein [Candidatus Deferrimicrobium sp.]
MATYSFKVNNSNKSIVSIDDFFHDAAFIWHRDKKERTVFDLWLHVIDHCTRLVEAVRKEMPKKVIDDLADTIMWFFSFIAQALNSDNFIDNAFRIDKSPSDLIWNKYPCVCPACFDFLITDMINATNETEAERLLKENDNIIRDELIALSRNDDILTVCNCLSRIFFAEERHNIYKKVSCDLDKLRLFYADITRERHKKKTVLELETMFERIFTNSYHVFSVQNIAFHLLEEVGEVSQALKDRYTYDETREPYEMNRILERKNKLEEEIADVFSWIFALLLKLKRVYYQDAQEYFQTLLPKGVPLKIEFDFLNQISLAEIIWSKYGRKEDGSLSDSMLCTGCYRAPCECKRDLKIDWYKLSENGEEHSPS